MIRVAVVGAGEFGRNHVRVVGENPRAQLVGVVDIDPSRATVSSIEEIIGKADAAIVAVPTSAHAEIACRLLDAGIDVLVEKPIAGTLAEADRMIAAAEGGGRILQALHDSRRLQAAQEIARHRHLV